MTQKNYPDVMLREIYETEISTYNPTPTVWKQMYVHMWERREHANIPPVVFSEWVGLGLWMRVWIFCPPFSWSVNKTKQKLKTDAWQRRHTFFSKPMAMSVYKVLSWASSSMMALRGRGRSPVSIQTTSPPTTPQSRPDGDGATGHSAPMQSPCVK